MKIRVGIADDHQLFMKSLSLLVSSLSGFEVVCEALNGSELIKKIQLQPEAPDMLLIDVEMPVMDGAQTVSIISASHPQVLMVALSMKEDDSSVIRMLRAGSAAYLLKDIHPDELEKALHEVHVKGYYNADVFNINYRRLIVKNQEEAALHITDREKRISPVCLQ